MYKLWMSSIPVQRRKKLWKFKKRRERRRNKKVNPARWRRCGRACRRVNDDPTFFCTASPYPRRRSCSWKADSTIWPPKPSLVWPSSCKQFTKTIKKLVFQIIGDYNINLSSEMELFIFKVLILDTQKKTKDSGN